VIDLATLYSSRAGLEPGAPTFAGRRETLTDLFRRLSNPTAMPSVAVVGPRRCGKTSLLKQILSPNVRQRFRGDAGCWDVAYIDLSSSPWRGFDFFRRRFLRLMAEARGIDGFEPDAEDCIEDVVSSLLRGSSKPLVAILDECRTSRSVSKRPQIRNRCRCCERTNCLARTHRRCRFGSRACSRDRIASARCTNRSGSARSG
jgi:hypothetical protein